MLNEDRQTDRQTLLISKRNSPVNPLISEYFVYYGREIASIPKTKKKLSFGQKCANLTDAKCVCVLLHCVAGIRETFNHVLAISHFKMRLETQMKESY